MPVAKWPAQIVLERTPQAFDENIVERTSATALAFKLRGDFVHFQGCPLAKRGSFSFEEIV
jgi:hypothetical protein